MQYPSIERVMEARDDYIGFCIECGAERDSCEPDARKYECENCGKKSVYGAEECALMGFVS